jgi:hypothetical protein
MERGGLKSARLPSHSPARREATVQMKYVSAFDPVLHVIRRPADSSPLDETAMVRRRETA